MIKKKGIRILTPDTANGLYLTVLKKVVQNVMNTGNLTTFCQTAPTETIYMAIFTAVTCRLLNLSCLTYSQKNSIRFHHRFACHTQVNFGI